MPVQGVVICGRGGEAAKRGGSEVAAYGDGRRGRFLQAATRESAMLLPVRAGARKQCCASALCAPPPVKQIYDVAESGKSASNRSDDRVEQEMP